MKYQNFMQSSITQIQSQKEVITAITWTVSLMSIIAGKGFPPFSPFLYAILALVTLSLSEYI